MSAQSVICYPGSFLERPEDRLFLMKLAGAGVPEALAKLALYRIWADFATGGSDRRPVDAENLDSDRHVAVLEDFCRWSGGRGALVRMAVDAGFLTIETPETGSLLVCNGFYPINSAFNSRGRNFQKRGGLVRGLNRQLQAVVPDARKRLELWERNGLSPMPEVDSEVRREGLIFVYRVARALGLPIPTDADLASGVLRLGIECVSGSDEESNKEAMLYLLSRKGEPDLPDRLDAVLRKWPEYLKKSALEMR